MKNEYIAVIQAGGKGTRMISLTNDEIPKPMLKLNGRPMIEWQIENLKENNIYDICIIIGHKGEKIEEYFGDGSYFGVKITYIREDNPLGSAGALYYVKNRYPDKDILLIFGDVMFKLDWKRMISFHEEKGALATLLIHPNAHPYDSDLVIIDDSQCVKAFDSKNNIRDYYYENMVNAGIYIIDKGLIASFEEEKKQDLEKDVITPVLMTNKVYGYHTTEYVKDAGTPERFKKCEEELIAGVWDKRCLFNKQKAIFLDRDGTINKYNGLVASCEQLELEEGVSEAIKLINSSEYLAICVTNQPVVARGMCSIEDVNQIHRKLQTLLGSEGAYLDDIIFCPHHPDKGYEGENPLYKIVCDCRKPGIGMLEKMAKVYNIDLNRSYMIGDTTMDIKTGINAGTTTVLLKTGLAGSDKKYDVSADFVSDTLLSAVSMILNNKVD